MSKFLEPIYRMVPNSVANKEVFRLCVFVFDAESRELIALEEVVKGDAPPVTESEQPFSMPFGEGVAGLVFKRGEAISYCSPAIGNQRVPGMSLFRKAEEFNLKAILGMPLFHPDAWTYAQDKAENDQTVTWADLPGRDQAIGVITLASDSEASGLAAFQEGSNAIELFEKVDGLIRDNSSELLQTILDAILEIH